jgi:hypothetical protein
MHRWLVDNPVGRPSTPVNKQANNHPRDFARLIVVLVSTPLRLRRKHIRAMLYGQDALAVNLHIHLGFIAERQPELVYLLIFADKVGAVYPKRRLLGGVAGNLYDGKIVALDPDTSFEQIFVLPPRRDRPEVSFEAGRQLY